MLFAATWMDLKIIILSGISQRKTNIIQYHLYAESKKMIQMNLFTKQKQAHRHRKQAYDYERGQRWGEWGINQEFGINIYTTIYKIHKQQGPTVQTGNSAQYQVTT